jgi:hypothetical protein
VLAPLTPLPPALLSPAALAQAMAKPGLGRIVALHHRPSALHQIH